jgi:hypothetical protein
LFQFRSVTRSSYGPTTLGATGAIEQVFNSHVNAVQKLDIDDVAPDLLDTYEELRGGRRAAE